MVQDFSIYLHTGVKRDPKKYAIYKTLNEPIVYDIHVYEIRS